MIMSVVLPIEKFFGGEQRIGLEILVTASERSNGLLRHDLLKRLNVSLVNLANEVWVGLQHVVQSLDELVLRQWFGPEVRLHLHRLWRRLLFDRVRLLEHGRRDKCRLVGGLRLENSWLLKLHRRLW